MSNKPDPYNRILEAAKAGKGVRLSAEEAHALSFDDAIVQAAWNIKEEMDSSGSSWVPDHIKAVAQ